MTRLDRFIKSLRILHPNLKEKSKSSLSRKTSEEVNSSTKPKEKEVTTPLPQPIQKNTGNKKEQKIIQHYKKIIEIIDKD
jgi:hypothetical protein